MESILGLLKVKKFGREGADGGGERAEGEGGGEGRTICKC